MSLYIALGDSMSIDDYAGGPGQGAASLLAADLGHELLLLARDGATSDDVVRHQLDRITGTPALVTLTMGGNDLISALFTAAAAGDTHLDTMVGEVLSRVTTACEIVLRTVVPTGARTVVSTVYDPTDGTGEFPGRREREIKRGRVR